MEELVKGDIVVIPFPFSDLSGSKRRPALVLANLRGDDILLCQITSRHSNDTSAVALNPTGFITGSLPVDSYIRPMRIFTADKNIIIRKAGTITRVLADKVIDDIVSILKS
jgi:mRNA interferase MazF